MSGLMSHYSYDVSIGVSIKLCCTMNGLNVTRKLHCTRMAMFTVLMSLWPGRHSSEYWCQCETVLYNDVNMVSMMWLCDCDCCCVDWWPWGCGWQQCCCLTGCLTPATGGVETITWWRQGPGWSPLYTRPLPCHPAWSTPHQGPYIIRSCRSKEDVQGGGKVI